MQHPGSGWRLGIDIGGTFTDVVAVDDRSGAVRSAKVPSVPDDPLAALVAGIDAVGLAWEEVAALTHGTTMVTNDIVQERFAPTALVATAGFTDTLDIGRMSRRHLYRLDLPPKEAALVPAALRVPVDERMLHDGTVERPLDAAEVERVADAVARLVADGGVAAVAVCLLHAYRNPAHEIRLGERLARVVPHVCLSHRISPERREYERMNTTVLAAALKPRVQGYLDRIEARRPARSRFRFFHSGGGMATIPAVAEHPLMLALSGPAAGVAACARLAADLGIDQALTFDMGGTTTDVCLIVEGRARIASDHRIAGRRVRLPILAVESIGAGGGSIARLDAGALRVGPESAGADPGPACYGRGGTAPTVSDADLVLGHLEAGRRLGNALTPGSSPGLRLDRALAEAALRPIAGATGFPLAETALGIRRVTHAGMVRALRRITVERGVDGRACPLIAFGGAGPMHAAEVARAYGIGHVIVPAFSSGFSALGCVAARMTHARQQTLSIASADWDAAAVAAARDALVADLSAPLVEAGHSAEFLTVAVEAAVRYRGQSDTVSVPDPALDDPAALGAAFRARHAALYGFSTDEPWELAGLRVEVAAPAPADALPVPPPEDAADGRSRLCIFDAVGPVDTPCLPRAGLEPGGWRPGPAIIEDAWSTIVVPPADRFRVDARGHVHIRVETA